MLKILIRAEILRKFALPGLAVIACIIFVRLTGSLQLLEWIAFDNFLQLRPPEASDPEVVIVGINEDDIRTVGKYPIPDRDLAQLLTIIQSYKPAAIGLDIFRDLTYSPDRAILSNILENSPNLIGIEAALNTRSSLVVKPPPELPPNRIAISDVILDPDGKLRRCLLASRGNESQIKYSLSLKLAQLYLRSKGISFKHGARADFPIFFGNTELNRFHSHTGAYVNAASGGNQILINYRSSKYPFTIVSLTDVLSNRVKPQLMQNRIVLIGMMTTSINDTFMTSATKGTWLTDVVNSTDQYQLIYGVEYHAHATSQIINNVLNKRPFIQTWFFAWDYLWIFTWGILGIATGLLLQSPWKTLLSLALASFLLILICYSLIVVSWWIPLVPTLLALCGAGLTTSLFDQNYRVFMEQRILTLKRTYDAVHNGPLQTIAAMLRSLDDNSSNSQLRMQLQALNYEVRTVYEVMNQELLSCNNRYVDTPIPTLLYEIYENTLMRSLPGFDTIKTYIAPDFTPLEDCYLSPEHKIGLCLFLEEALCNVGKHAKNATRLDVVCKREKSLCILQIIDNGFNYQSNYSGGRHAQSGRGTIQAKELSSKLRGTFQRKVRLPQGIICELTWRDIKPWWQRILKKS
ncbi:hypothetical protein DSM106972_095730 [Dulcicalothrix desertica PCC 7102]|uniref:CHASE2 domain-containing protein n=1 Tax=Dulcicalothrix desertica PCC 7102 TaxID=232991 RepID=A0A3S1A4P8_9CYAN|nr:CHASE2 domain-containing protein [Dulcicalothrix desertica]RUS93632.1 hypothetical protein DSM106972_095730 [Dulcicalothrix desertica PCC 7102]TWH43955.1 CHASE2 domain-containing sensor protein [Dulcicalothrix desertica PCC 7102]